MTTIHLPGYPRIGARRQLKFALEAYWAGTLTDTELRHTGTSLRQRHWQQQADAGAQLVPVGDFAWYDQILEWSATLGAVPPRFAHSHGEPVSLDTLFLMARGGQVDGHTVAACEMTKWFDTNYHYLVPELSPDMSFCLSSDALFEQVREAQAQGLVPKPVIPGPLTWLWLGRGEGYGDATDVDKLALLDRLVPVYREVLSRLAALGVDWVQVDEPLLATDLPAAWRRQMLRVYDQLAGASDCRLLLASYFGDLEENLDTATALPVDGLHLDLVRGPAQLGRILPRLGERVLSAGVIDGRNVWRADLTALAGQLRAAHAALGERLWLSSSCSLLHVPLDLAAESALPEPLRHWLSFAVQKLEELSLLRDLLNGEQPAQLATHQQRVSERQQVLARQRCAPADHSGHRRPTPFADRSEAQRQALGLPAFPTTTIGSFPQTRSIRQLRRDWRRGDVSDADYQAALATEIEHCIREQEALELDVLVHGEAERTDMVEYFAEHLEGFATTGHGWVQSYGSRCVKPPIIHGPVSRPADITVAWSRHAQSLTPRPVKGMLTGPVTLLQWSFVRDDQPRSDTCADIARALRDEVLALEQAGIRVIQIDEPALREGLPLRQQQWDEYLAWAVACFRLTCADVADTTQIHTHMCYADFNDILAAIADMDADVITIETSRSNMALLEAFEAFRYPNDIGPGVYDIHSPAVPERGWMEALLRKAAQRLPPERLWVNPDCGLKTRSWEETRQALAAMVGAARALRAG